MRKPANGSSDEPDVDAAEQPAAAHHVTRADAHQQKARAVLRGQLEEIEQMRPGLAGAAANSVLLLISQMKATIDQLE